MLQNILEKIFKNLTVNGKFNNNVGKRRARGQSEFKKPWGIALDSKNNVYVSDQTIPRVQKFDSDGNFYSICGVKKVQRKVNLYIYMI